MKKVELLAPAGSFEALEAAVMCGADAIYLGGMKFGARAFATNFDNDEMIKAVNYVHLYGVKLYVTVNTLIYDDEVSSFLDYIAFLNKIGVDAFIIQDLGMLHLLATIYPNLELHASTQMHVHNIETLQKLKNLGVKRVVLPREYPLSLISKLKEDSGLDIEVFIHGALCVSYSGQCLMSYLIGGRSGNRGECAGSCRLPYKLVEVNNGRESIIDTDGDYVLSTKDLFTLDNINEIIKSGVDSLKIEGRMKRPEYVALVTTLYRRTIDSYYKGEKYHVTEQDIIDLKKMFNRGFTKGYILGDKGKLIMNPVRPNHMGIPIGKVINIDKSKIIVKLTSDVSLGDGIRIVSNEDVGFTVSRMFKNDMAVKEAFMGDIVAFDYVSDVKIGSEVLKTTDVKLIDNIRQWYQHNNRKIKLSAVIIGKIGENLKLTISDGINEVTTESEIKVASAVNSPITKEIIEEKLNKIGDTPYIFDNIDIKIDDNIFIPLTSINALKRESLNKIGDLRVKRIPDDRVKLYDLEVPNVEQDRVLIKAKVRTKDQYQACIDNNIDMIYIENRILYNEVKGNDKVVLALSRVRKNKINSTGKVLAGDLGAITNNTISDYSLNVVNAYTASFMYLMGATTVTLAYEMDMSKTKQLINNYRSLHHSNPNLEIIIYGRIEAMITEYCPLFTYLKKEGEACNICKNNKKYYLRDRFNNDYVLVFDNCMMSIYNYKKINLIKDINSYKKLGINNFRFNFIDESYEECSTIIKSVILNNK